MTWWQNLNLSLCFVTKCQHHEISPNAESASKAETQRGIRKGEGLARFGNKGRNVEVYKILMLHCERLKKLRKRALGAKSKQQISNFGIASHFLKLCHLCVWISMMVCPRTSHMSSRRSLQRWMGGVFKFCNGLRSICLKP